MNSKAFVRILTFFVMLSCQTVLWAGWHSGTDFRIPHAGALAWQSEDHVLLLHHRSQRHPDFQGINVVGVAKATKNRVFSQPAGIGLAAATNASLAALARQDGGIVLVDGEAWEARDTLAGLPAEQARLAFAADAGALVVAYDFGRIQRWDLTTKNVSMDFDIGSAIAPETFALAANGNFAASLSAGGDAIIVWDCCSGTRAHDFAVDAGSATQIDLAPDGGLLAISTADLLRVLDVKKRQDVFTVDAARSPYRFAPLLGAKGRLLAHDSSRAWAAVWDLGEDRLQSEIFVNRLTGDEFDSDTQGPKLQFSPAGTRLALISNIHTLCPEPVSHFGRIDIFDCESGHLIRMMPQVNRFAVEAVAYAGASPELATRDRSGETLVWRRQGEGLRHRLYTPSEYLALGFGSSRVFAAEASTVWEYDAVSGKATRSFNIGHGADRGLELAPGPYLVAASDTSITVLQLDNGQVKYVFKPPGSKLGRFKLVNFDKELCIAADDGAIEIRKLSDGTIKLQRTIRDTLPGGAGGVIGAIDNDGRQVVTIGPTSRVWNLLTGEVILAIEDRIDMLWFLPYNNHLFVETSIDVQGDYPGTLLKSFAVQIPSGNRMCESERFIAELPVKPRLRVYHHSRDGSRWAFFGCAAGFNSEIVCGLVSVGVDDDYRRERQEAAHIHVSPNPGRGIVTLSVRLAHPQTTGVDVSVRDLKGRLVATLARDNLPAGEHRFPFDASSLARGVYYCEVRTAFDRHSTMLLLRP